MTDDEAIPSVAEIKRRRRASEKITGRDPFGKATVALLRRAGRIGLKRALEEEVHAPRLPSDPDWCGMIVALATEQPFEAARPNQYSASDITVCATCNDLGLVVETDTSNGALISVPCDDCKRGESVMRGDLKREVMNRARAAEAKNKKKKQERRSDGLRPIGASAQGNNSSADASQLTEGPASSVDRAARNDD